MVVCFRSKKLSILPLTRLFLAITLLVVIVVEVLSVVLFTLLFDVVWGFSLLGLRSLRFALNLLGLGGFFGVLCFGLTGVGFVLLQDLGLDVLVFLGVTVIAL